MHQRAIGKRQQGLCGLPFGFWVAIQTVLVNRIIDALGEVGLQLRRGHRQSVGGMASEDVGINRQRRFELGKLQRGFKTQQFDTVAQNIQRAALVELITQAVQQCFNSLRAVVLGQGVPGLRPA